MYTKLLKSTPIDYIEMDVNLLAESLSAVLVKNDIGREWIPKSQLQDAWCSPAEMKLHSKGVACAIRIVIPEWLGKQKGLVK